MEREIEGERVKSQTKCMETTVIHHWKINSETKILNPHKM